MRKTASAAMRHYFDNHPLLARFRRSVTASYKTPQYAYWLPS